MKHRDEINEIRDMIDVMKPSNNVNFSHTIYDEELTEGVTYLSKNDTGLSSDVIVDTGETYKYSNHPLCLYVVDGKNVHPVSITEVPSSFDGYNVPNDIIIFIRQNLNTLIEVADLKIDGYEFFERIEEWEKSDHGVSFIAEMSTFPPQKTGLPVYVYIDDTGSYKNSGHNQSYRMKFQQDKDITNPRKWLPIAIPSLEIMDKDTVPSCTIPKRDVNMVLEWAKANLELLLDLRDGKITGEYFKKNMLKIENIKVILSSQSKK